MFQLNKPMFNVMVLDCAYTPDAWQEGKAGPIEQAIDAQDQDEHVSAALRCCSVDVCWHSLQTRHSFSSMLISASLTLTEL
jgi:hypothetical protein